MAKIDSYKHMDDDSKVTVQLSMPVMANRVCSLNYGAHRLLSAMVHELRARRINLPEENQDSPLADAIEAALNAGYYY